MSIEGLDSFVTKFKDLWRSGHHAKLTVTTHAGKAWVNLNAGLGRLPMPDNGNPGQGDQQKGNTRQRRHERRAAERVVAAEQVAASTDLSTIAEEANESESETFKEKKAEKASKNLNERSAGEASDKSELVRIAAEVTDEFCKEDEEKEGEELVIVFGEYSSKEAFNDKPYFKEMKEKLSRGTSYFHYDGTYWKERENVTGFYQTVRLKSGFCRKFLKETRNWPAGTKIVEIRATEDDSYK